MAVNKGKGSLIVEGSLNKSRGALGIHDREQKTFFVSVYAHELACCTDSISCLPGRRNSGTVQSAQHVSGSHCPKTPERLAYWGLSGFWHPKPSENLERFQRRGVRPSKHWNLKAVRAVPEDPSRELKKSVP